MISKLVIDQVFLVWIVSVLDERDNLIVQRDNSVFPGLGFHAAYHVLFILFKPTVAELREIYAELVSPVLSDWSEGWEKVSKAIGHYGMYQEEVAMESFDEVTREVVKRLGFQNICLSENIVVDRARFAEIYQAIQRRKRTEVNVGSVLPNLREMVQNRLAELEQKRRKAIEQEKDKN